MAAKAAIHAFLEAQRKRSLFCKKASQKTFAPGVLGD
jgi:hypothetical protein